MEMNTVLLGTPIRLIQKSSVSAHEPSNSQYTKDEFSKKNSGRLKKTVIGKFNPPSKNMEFDFEISQWSTSTTQDDTDFFLPESVEKKRYKKAFLEISDLKIRGKNNEGSMAEPVIPKGTPVYTSILARTSRLSSPLCIPSALKAERKMMMRTAPPRLRAPPKPLVLELSQTFTKTDSRRVLQLSIEDSLSYADCDAQLENESRNKPMGVWGYQASHLCRENMPNADRRFTNGNWRVRLRLSALFVQCSYRAHIARRIFSHLKATACPKIREMSRGAAQKQLLRNALFNKLLPLQVSDDTYHEPSFLDFKKLETNL